jgi:hypothetical protein
MLIQTNAAPCHCCSTFTGLSVLHLHSIESRILKMQKDKATSAASGGGSNTTSNAGALSKDQAKDIKIGDYSEYQHFCYTHYRIIAQFCYLEQLPFIIATAACVLSQCSYCSCVLCSAATTKQCN